MVDFNVFNLCNFFLDVYVCLKFKNVVCEMCNGNLGCDIEYSKEKNVGLIIDEEILLVIKFYRFMFVLFLFDFI